VEGLINMIPFAEKTISFVAMILNKENQTFWLNYNKQIMYCNKLQRNSTEKLIYEQSSRYCKDAQNRLDALYFMNQTTNHNKACTCHY